MARGTLYASCMARPCKIVQSTRSLARPSWIVQSIRCEMKSFTKEMFIFTKWNVLSPQGTHEMLTTVCPKGRSPTFLFRSRHMTYNIAQHRAEPNVFPRHTDDEDTYRGGAPQTSQEKDSRS